MQIGVHLPQTALHEESLSLEGLLTYVREARILGFGSLAVFDHFITPTPFLDGPSALAAVLPEAEGMGIALAVALPIIRTPLSLSKTVATLDVLSGGRLILGLGPGSAKADYELAGIPWAERGSRFEEAIVTVRALLDPSAPPAKGTFYSSDGSVPRPYPRRRPLPIWIGSWGSERGLRRTARLGDGWMASALRVNPERFVQRRSELGDYLKAEGKDPDRFPNAVTTTVFHVTDDARRAEMVRREVDQRGGEPPRHLPIGSPEECAARMDAYAMAGVERLFLLPAGDPIRQITAFKERVAPLLRG